MLHINRASPRLPETGVTELLSPKERDRNRDVCEGLSVLPMESVKGKIIKSVRIVNLQLMSAGKRTQANFQDN